MNVSAMDVTRRLAQAGRAEDLSAAENELESGDALTRFSAAIANGAAIDWQQAAKELDAALLDQLKQIQSLVQGFGAVSFDATSATVAKQNFSADLHDSALAPGSYFAHLRVLECLGHGAYGRVYRAFDERLQRAVALKIPFANLQSAAKRSELLREGQHMARVDHPNVLKVYGALEAVIPSAEPEPNGSASNGSAHASASIGFSCELMQGENLEHWLQCQGVLGAGELRAIAADLCAGLAALHQCQIIHGDLKPANVLRHQAGRWVVADFGSSQSGGAPEPSSGTPHFMAPEQFQAQPPSTLADQYALGALLFRLATRRHPFEAETLDELKTMHALDQRPRLLDLRPDLPPPLIAAIERALSINPAQRFRSIGAFAAQLALPAHSIATKYRIAIAAGILLPLFMLSWQIFRAPVTPPASATGMTWTRNRAGVAETLLAGAQVQPGESLALNLELTQPTYVYVINEDSVGARFQLFPLVGFALQNPLPPGRIRLPGSHAGEQSGRAQDWVITSHGGRERFYVIYSLHALPELAQLAFTQASSQLPMRSEHYAANNADSAMRGVGGVAAQSAEATDLLDSAWLRQLQSANPGVRVSRFDVLNP